MIFNFVSQSGIMKLQWRDQKLNPMVHIIYFYPHQSTLSGLKKEGKLYCLINPHAELGFCSSLFTEETAVYFLQKYECFSFTPLHPCTFQTCKYLELCSLWWNKHNQGSMSTLYKTLFLSQSRAYVLNSLKVVVLWKMFVFYCCLAPLEGLIQNCPIFFQTS